MRHCRMLRCLYPLLYPSRSSRLIIILNNTSASKPTQHGGKELIAFRCSSMSNAREYSSTVGYMLGTRESCSDKQAAACCVIPARFALSFTAWYMYTDERTHLCKPKRIYAPDCVVYWFRWYFDRYDDSSGASRCAAELWMERDIHIQQFEDSERLCIVKKPTTASVYLR